MLGEMLLSENHPMTYFDVTQNVIDEHSGKRVVTSLRQFNLIDKNSNGVIDYHEIVTASSYDVHKFFKFSKIGLLVHFIYINKFEIFKLSSVLIILELDFLFIIVFVYNIPIHKLVLLIVSTTYRNIYLYAFLKIKLYIYTFDNSVCLN